MDIFIPAVILGLAVYYTWDSIREWIRIIYVRWTR